MKRNTLKLGVAFGIMAVFAFNNTYAQKHGRKRMHKNPPSTEQIFKDLDTNKDGKISIKEAKGPLKNHLKKVDSNNDGFITKEELEKKHKSERRACKDEKGFKQNKGIHKNRPSAEQVFKDLDTNKDGNIDKNEAKGLLSNHFEKVDSNKDGFITKKELKKTPKPER